MFVKKNCFMLLMEALILSLLVISNKQAHISNGSILVALRCVTLRYVFLSHQWASKDNQYFS